ncbi:MAG: hypothetical protein HRU05_04720 [Oceanospirillaceae bacterium]|nr:hypothetical protein [Oceanospirillaceae bacterium]
MKKLIILSLAVLLSGCDTVYQPLGWDGGYQEQQLRHGHYRLNYQGNSTTPDQWVLQSWHRRAAQLCPSGYAILAINIQQPLSSDATIKTLLNNPLSRRNPEVSGELKCTR